MIGVHDFAGPGWATLCESESFLQAAVLLEALLGNSICMLFCLNKASSHCMTQAARRALILGFPSYFVFAERTSKYSMILTGDGHKLPWPTCGLVLTHVLYVACLDMAFACGQIEQDDPRASTYGSLGMSLRGR